MNTDNTNRINKNTSPTTNDKLGSTNRLDNNEPDKSSLDEMQSLVGGSRPNVLLRAANDAIDGGTDVVWRCQFRSRIPGLGGLMRVGIARMFRGTLRGLERDLG